MKKHKRLLSLLLAALLALGAGITYVTDYYRADEAVIAVFCPAIDVAVSKPERDVMVFEPEKPVAGMIFYPGGKVEYTAYVPLMEECAAQGILCVLARMPLNLAVLDAHAADDLRRTHPEIDRWYIAGHSLGGAMAATCAGSHPQEYEGLILLAAYSDSDLSDTQLRILLVYGSEDGVLNAEKYTGNREKLPENFKEIVIDGGCHAGFGMYGPQEGDGTPTVSAEEQIRITAQAISEFLNE